MLTLDGQKYLIQVPLVARPRTATPQLISILLAKLATPFPNRFIGYHYAAFEQYFFHIAEAQAEAKVQPHGVADDFDRKPMMLVFRGSGRCVHTATLSHSVGSHKLTTPFAWAA